MLSIYDLVVHGLSNRFAWRCPTRRLLDLYRAHLSADHLEAGVGTGFFLDRTGDARIDRLALVDINRHCLDRAGRRLARFDPALIPGEPAGSDRARRAALRVCRPDLCAALLARPHEREAESGRPFAPADA